MALRGYFCFKFKKAYPKGYALARGTVPLAEHTCVAVFASNLKRLPMWSLFKYKSVDKPSSVVDGHLSGQRITACLKPPVRAQSDEQPIALVGVASDRVYSRPMSP